MRPTKRKTEKASEVKKEFTGSEQVVPARTKEKRASVKSEIVIPPLKMQIAQITLQGVSPLLVNQFDRKCLEEISENYIQKARKQVKTTEKVVKDSDESFKASLYIMSGKNRYGMPAAGIKKSAVTAAKRFVEGLHGTIVEGAFHVIDEENGLIEIKSKSGPVPDKRMVRVGNFGNKKPALRTRARFDDWEVEFQIRYRPDILSAEQLLNLFENAGFSVGLCEYRPEKSGNLGMFCVKRG